ncbi:hypothetical protein QP371_05660 [Gardnerella swidsinskii]|uniref:Uncharacterized protein n=1 Tax=Gardnerella swidsinskii TaxID=2792979 RepID=A0ABN4V176_9BIFI|nr:hypothetical protein BVL65_05520 [Gardnerella vaginalis]MDK6294965.1 hypothetical protein [Gardnerella swidsinskii]MDK7093668.1 hypothetical protein [Gardnerella swidsinskii]NSX39252.1 hypothetical protein [Gardnerella vaginalis]
MPVGFMNQQVLPGVQNTALSAANEREISQTTKANVDTNASKHNHAQNQQANSRQKLKRKIM